MVTIVVEYGHEKVRYQTVVEGEQIEAARVRLDAVLLLKIEAFQFDSTDRQISYQMYVRL